MKNTNKIIKSIVFCTFCITFVTILLVFAIKKEQEDREYCESKGLVYHQPWKAKAICIEGSYIPHKIGD